VRAVRLHDGTTVVLRSGITADAVRNESRVLDALRPTPVPAPRLVAADPGAGLLLMTREAGRVDLQPRDPDGWLAQLAAVLPVIHAAPIAAGPFQPWFDLATVSAESAVRQRAIELARAARRDDERCFIHRDFQHFNVLWSRGRLTAVVDWTWASRGDPDVDVGHCVLNLAALFSADVAMRFVDRYEQVAGRAADLGLIAAEVLSYNPGWPTMIPVQAAGVPVDAAGMDGRVEATLEEIVRRAG
jgi:aminoglycoside phosphotransferase (APT) family kinase protein